MTPCAPLDDRWRTDPDGCCQVRKVNTLERAMLGRVAWISGLRRADSPDRATTPVVERDRRNIVKINPIARWSDDDVAAYIAAHDVVVNPLVAQGYPSIGCWPCTRAVGDGEHARAGAGTAPSRPSAGCTGERGTVEDRDDRVPRGAGPGDPELLTVRAACAAA